MARPVAVHIEHIEEALRTLRARGVPVEYVNNRVRGLADLRRITGGDADRVRAMAVLLLEREGAKVGPGELRRAQASLRRGDTVDRAGRRNGADGAATLAAIREFAEAAALILRRAASAATAATGCRESHCETLGEPHHGTQEQFRMHGSQPAGPSSSAITGEAENPPTNGTGGALASLRAAQRARALPESLDFDPFDIDNLGGGRAPVPFGGRGDE